jgi:hypothetical protein
MVVGSVGGVLLLVRADAGFAFNAKAPRWLDALRRVIGQGGGMLHCWRHCLRAASVCLQNHVIVFDFVVSQIP